MKRKILAIGFVISLVFAYCLSGLQQSPAQAEESTTTDYDQQIRQMEAEKAALTRETETAVYALDRKRREEEELIYELREVQDFLDSIPPEVLEELKANYQAQQQELEL